MLYFLLAVFLIFSGVNGSDKGIIEDFMLNPGKSDATIPISPIRDDTDDTDDFVPYRNERHDAFDWKVLKIVLQKDNSSNVIISPFSVKLVLALLSEAAGDGSATQNELASIFPNLRSPVLIRDLYKRILGSLKEPSLKYNLNVGTKMYVDHNITPRQRYSAIIQSHYDTNVEQLDFQDSEQSAQIMNNWCANITAGQLQSLVNEGDLRNSIMLLINAVYFDGLWRHEFSENDTSELPFFVSPSRSIRTEFMIQTKSFYFYESAKWNAKILRMPYKGQKFSMTILLPNEDANLDELVEKMDGDAFKRLQWLMNEKRVKISIPKFKFDYTSHMKDTLKHLGINEIFTKRAALPGLARGTGLASELYVSDIIQKSGLVVHERGTTAHSATEVELENKFGNRYLFDANRPFVFFIEDETTGTLLFAGKVVNPTNAL